MKTRNLSLLCGLLLAGCQPPDKSTVPEVEYGTNKSPTAPNAAESTNPAFEGSALTNRAKPAPDQP